MSKKQELSLSKLANQIRVPKSCPYCKAKNVVRRGNREKKHEIIPLYSCKSCAKKFTGQIARGKQFPTSVILDAISHYHLGYSLKDVQAQLKEKHGLKIERRTLLRWSDEYAALCPFLRLREQALKLSKPEKMIEKVRLNHKQIYTHLFHPVKLKLLLDDPKHHSFAPLMGFLNSIPSECPHDVFVKNEARASQSKQLFSQSYLAIDEKENLAVRIARCVLQAVSNNHQRHDTLARFMIMNDSVTIATEVPVILEKEAIEHFRKKWRWKIPKQLDQTVTGHIDLLQVRNGYLRILDFKPSSKQVDAVDQLVIYALALSDLTGIPLYKMTCAWFDDERYYEFWPLDVVSPRVQPLRSTFLGSDEQSYCDPAEADDLVHYKKGA